MIEIESDNAKNFFTIRYRGHIDATETASWLGRVETAIAKMQTGFGLLADLTYLESMDVACAPHIRKVMDFCNARGIAVVVRVIPDPKRDIGLEIMSRFHYGGNVRTVTCATVEEAMKILFE